MPYGDEKSYSFFKLKMGNSPLKWDPFGFKRRRLKKEKEEEQEQMRQDDLVRARKGFAKYEN